MGKETVKESAGKAVSASRPAATPASVAPAGALSPFEEMDRLFDQLFDRGWMRPLGWERPFRQHLATADPRLPRVDVIDNEKDIVVRAEMPGVDRKDVEVSVNDSSVTIKGEHRTESRSEKGDFYRCEISRGSFSRTVGLPGEVDADKAEAKMNDGILELRLPKVKAARRRRVEVK